jgi:glycosyltransferase involved in cell wall biosynthesis
MRILFATSIKTWGGGEEWMLSAAEGLGRRGHSVTLAARPASAILERARADGIASIEVSFRCDADLSSFWRIHRHCRRDRPEALVLNTDRVLRLAGTAARLAGVAVVLPRRGSEFPIKSAPTYRFFYRKIATGMIVNSRATARTLVERIDWRPAGRLHVLLNGLDLTRFERPRPVEEVRAELDIPTGSTVLLVVGELTPRKNPGLVVEILPRLLGGHPEVLVLFVGEGPERERLAALASENGIADRVRLLGFRRDVPDLLGAADLLVHPARVEGFGYAVAEGMAAGLPVVATNASSLPEIVEDGHTGLLFPLDDAGALEAAVRTYLRDPERRRRDGEAGRERIRREFSRERRLDELEELLQDEIRRATPGVR